MNLGPSLRLRHFFATTPVPCPYLAGRVEQKLVVELAGDDAPDLFAELSRSGFRRSHGFAYRPACRDCKACLPVRIRVADFRPSRSLRRVWQRCLDLSAEERPPRATPEQYRLFVAYQQGRHATSEMAAMTWTDYRMMVETTPVDTVTAEFRDGGGVLVGASLIDRTADGLSAVYSFFDPQQRRRSLGTYAILWMLRRAATLGLPHVYLGYWIEGSATMDYKRRFPALEALIAGRWVPIGRTAD